MIRVTLPDRTIGISFRHSKNVEVAIPQTAKELKEGAKLRYRNTRATYCEIYELKLKPEDNSIISSKWICEGSGVVGIGDVFRKSEGRKWALTKALNQLKPLQHNDQKGLKRVPPFYLGKKDREKVWDAYEGRKALEIEKKGRIFENNVKELKVGLDHIKDSEYVIDRVLEKFFPSKGKRVVEGEKLSNESGA